MSNLVFVRLRPLKAGEKQACLGNLAPGASILNCKSSTNAKAEEFEFDQVLPSSCSQQDVFDGVKHIVQDVLEEGFNGTIMAYGQTSAGKTHTMFGSGSGSLRGIVPRVAGLASAIAARPGDCTFKISASVVEVYNEKCRDLLNPTQDNLQVFQDAQGVHVPGMTLIEVHSEEDCLKIVQKGTSDRAVAATDMNEASSRSHCLVILTVNKTWKDGRTQRSKLCLVDLAGSERQSKTNASGVTLQEGQNINKSLLVLGTVVNALNDSSSSGAAGAKASRVPYRDSKLTRLLQDSLGGTAKTCIVICCSPAMKNSSETLSSLRFGARARAIQCKAKSNAINQGPAASLAAAHAEICALKKAAEEREAAEVETEMSEGKRTTRLAMVWGISAVAQAVGVLVIFAADNFFAKYCEI